jgi:G:T/U-mismatch repair DNA glycosylase
MAEIHPYNDYASIPKATRLLIVGTAPPKRFSKRRPGCLLSNGDIDFYYGSKDNQLWQILFPDAFASGTKPSVDDLRAFLKRRRIWMHDICQKYTRKKEGALDKDLKILEAADLAQLFRHQPEIDTIVFTGRDAENKFGNEMERELIKQYSFWQGGMRNKPLPRERNLTFLIRGKPRKITTYTLPSPSRRNTTALDKKKKMYEDFVLQRTLRI